MKAKPTWHEWSDDEVARAVKILRSYPRRLTSLDYVHSHGYHVLRYRVAWGKTPPEAGWIVATRDERRLARILESLYRERAAPERKPVERLKVVEKRRAHGR